MRESNAQETAEFQVFPVARPTPDVAGRPIRVLAAGQTHIGKVRDVNEDHLLVARISRTMDVLNHSLLPSEVPALRELDGYILAVADGVGGHAAGERASGLVLSRGIELILASANWGLKLDEKEAQRLMARMREYLVDLNASLVQAVADDPSLDGMATTLTVAYTVGLQAFLVHVGDSRVYLFRDGKLTQWTRDHTVAQDLADGGQISVEEIRRHPRRHVLTNVVAGAHGFLKPDISSHPLQPNDVLLVCTDGLSDTVHPDRISRILSLKEKPKDACTALIDAALEAGGHDNITAVVARFTHAVDE